jgi:flavin reductase (DIM6/NTAB) family NADH-FMN oxidoreductase RutF
VAATPLRFERTPAPAPASPPRLGADTDAVLADAAERPATETRALRDAFGAFATGVTVVTTRDADGTPRGFTANSFTSVSLEPPMLLVCIGKGAASLPSFAEGARFAVTVLGEEQKAVSGLFASRRADKFELADWHDGPGGVPLIADGLAWFACARHRLVDAGDHIVLIGRVTDFGMREGAPLGYFRGGYFTPGLERPLVEAAAGAGRVAIGAVLEQERAVYLEGGETGPLRLPVTGEDGGPAGIERLIERLTRAGLSVALDFLYAVYRDRGCGMQRIYYHGTATGTAPGSGRFHALDAIPWDRLAIPAERSMLARYAEEHRHGTFGIYEGDEVSGRVRPLGAQAAARGAGGAG